jgi:hypothetical protein
MKNTEPSDATDEPLILRVRAWGLSIVSRGQQSDLVIVNGLRNLLVASVAVRAVGGVLVFNRHSQATALKALAVVLGNKSPKIAPKPAVANLPGNLHTTLANLSVHGVLRKREALTKPCSRIAITLVTH